MYELIFCWAIVVILAIGVVIGAIAQARSARHLPPPADHQSSPPDPPINCP